MTTLTHDIKKIIIDSGGSIPPASLVSKLLELGYIRKDITNAIHKGLDLGAIQLGNRLNIELGKELKDNG